MTEVIDFLKVNLDLKSIEVDGYHRCIEFKKWRQHMEDINNTVEIINVSTAINANEEYMILTITYRTNDDDPK